MMDWKPIETAPKDGKTFFLAFLGDTPDTQQTIWVAVYDVDLEDWMVDSPDGGWEFVSPTHWMPLPEPPK